MLTKQILRWNVRDCVGAGPFAGICREHSNYHLDTDIPYHPHMRISLLIYVNIPGQCGLTSLGSQHN